MNISSLSDYDTAKLVASFWYIVEDHFNCEKAKERLASRKDAQEMIKKLEIRNGCNTSCNYSGYVNKLTGKPWFEWNGINYYKCFCNFIDSSCHYIFNLYSFYSKGFLPFKGSISEQPAKVIEAFQLIESLKGEKMRAEEQKQKQKDKSSNGRRYQNNHRHR